MSKEYNIKNWKVRINLDKERAELLEYFFNKILDKSYNSYKEIKYIVQEMNDVLEYNEVFQIDTETKSFSCINIGGLRSSEIKNLYIIILKPGTNVENIVELMKKEKEQKFLALIGEHIKIYSEKKLTQNFLSKYTKNAKRIKMAGKYENNFYFTKEEDAFGAVIYSNSIMEIISVIELYLSVENFSFEIDEITYSYKTYLDKAEQLTEYINEYGLQEIIEDLEELVEISI